MNLAIGSRQLRNQGSLSLNLINQDRVSLPGWELNSVKTSYVGAFWIPVLLSSILLSIIAPAHFSTAEEFRITPETDLDPICKKAQAGDSIVLADGVWTDSKFEFSDLPGSQDAPIRILPESIGGVILTGKTDFRVSGTHVIVSGLVFRDCHGVEDVFQLRSHAERSAVNCRGKT